jgi:hypothetical protein
VRILFAGILIGSLGAWDRSTDAPDDRDSLKPLVVQVARSGGLTLRQETTITGTDIPALLFDAPGCSQPVLAVLLSLTFEEEPAARSAREPGYTTRFIYFERFWEQPHRLAVFIERLKYIALGLVSATNFIPYRHVLLVEAPEPCRAADDVDWSPLWRRVPETLAQPL